MELSSLFLLLLAVLPSCVIMFLVLVNVKHKRKPAKKVAQVIGISAFSVIPAVVLELIGEVILILAFMIMGADVEYLNTQGMLLYYFLQYMLVVGISEEACKFFTFKWIIFHDREFDNTYDGVIYGAASALGFATLENVMYVFMSNDSLSVALLRAATSIPMHAITGIVMGYYFGISKYRRYNNIQTKAHPERGAFVFSVLLHGFYDFIVTVPGIVDDEAVTIMMLVLLVVVMIGIYILMGMTIRRAKKETHNIYNRYYYEQLGGNIQDMFGGKTTEKRPMFMGMPLPMMYRSQPGAFNPYNPYASFGAPPPQPPMQNMPYGCRTQQPYNPYNNYGRNVNYMGNPDASNMQMGYAQPYSQTVNPNPQPQRQAVVTPDITAAPAKHCQSCGAKLVNTARFCNVCGEKVK